MYAERSLEGAAYSKHHILPTDHEAGLPGTALHYGGDVKEMATV